MVRTIARPLGRIPDQVEESQERKEADKQLDAFIHHVMHALLPVAATAGVRLIRGLLGVLMTRNDIGKIAQTRVSARAVHLISSGF